MFRINPFTGRLEYYTPSTTINGFSNAISIVAGTGIAISSISGVITVNATSTVTNFSENEIPSGTINGSNVTFTLAHTPVTNSLKLYVQGQRLKLTVEYNLSGLTITFTAGNAPLTGSEILADYRY